MRFVGNKGVDGAGLAVKNGTAIISRSQFSGNVAEQRGGALLLLGAPDVRLTDVTFADNRATNGGGVAAENSSAVFSKVTWSGNTAVNGNGGGLHSTNSGMQFTTANFTANQASVGGGIYRQAGTWSWRKSR